MYVFNEANNTITNKTPLIHKINLRIRRNISTVNTIKLKTNTLHTKMQKKKVTHGELRVGSATNI